MYRHFKTAAIFTVLICILLFGTAACTSQEEPPSGDSPDNNKAVEQGIGLYAGRIDNNFIEISVSKNLPIAAKGKFQSFKLSEKVKVYLDENSDKYNENTPVAFNFYPNEKEQLVITDIKHLSKAELKEEYRRFNAGEIEPGDNIMGLRASTVSVEEVEWSEEDKVKVVFDGEVTLEGIYTHHEDSPMLGHQIAFEISEKSAERLPKLDFDNRNDWFIITNHNKAEEELGPKGSRGNATIVVDEFTIDYRPGTDATNYATLVKVKEKD